VSETTRTLSEWIDLDLRERRQRRELLKQMAEYQKTHPPIIMAAFKPKAATPPPKVDQRPPVELSESPTHEELAAFMGISPKQLEEAIGMRFERLAQFMEREPGELAQLLAETLRIEPASKWAAKATTLRVAVAKLRLYGFNKFAASVQAKAKRASALKAYRARAKVRG
jgi:hypothetical protein